MSGLGFAPDWPAPPGVRAFVTERGGGVSTGAYASLNLGLHVGDDPDSVAENRRRLRRLAGLPAEPAWLAQVHGTRIVDLDALEAAAPPEADGAVASRAGAVCAIMTADCLPVLLADRGGSRVGAAHAGWRGLAGGVLAAAVAAMRTPPERLVAWLGPAIGPAAYEVGDDVRSAFVRADPLAAACFAANPRGRWQADLYALARRSLAAAGVEAVYGGGFCTFAETDRFFSHRRQAPCGRLATLIWRSS
jgi:YfiH family protein